MQNKKHRYAIYNGGIPGQTASDSTDGAAYDLD